MDGNGGGGEVETWGKCRCTASSGQWCPEQSKQRAGKKLPVLAGRA
jgi:hypothetical protein